MTFIDFVAIGMLLASFLVYIKTIQDNNIEFHQFMQGAISASVAFVVFALLSHMMP